MHHNTTSAHPRGQRTETIKKLHVEESPNHMEIGWNRCKQPQRSPCFQKTIRNRASYIKCIPKHPRSVVSKPQGRSPLFLATQAAITPTKRNSTECTETPVQLLLVIESSSCTRESSCRSGCKDSSTAIEGHKIGHSCRKEETTQVNKSHARSKTAAILHNVIHAAGSIAATR